MPYKVKKSQRSLSVPVGLAVGLGVGWSILLFGAMVTTWLLMGETVGETSMAPASVGTMLLACYLDCTVAARRIGKGKFVICLAAGGLFGLSLICGNALFFGGAYQGLIPGMLSILGVSLLASLIGSGKRKSRKWRP